MSASFQFRVGLALLSVVFALSSCDSQFAPSSISDGTFPVGDVSKVSQQVIEVFEQTNAFRDSYGVAPLSFSPQLNAAAQAFAESMGTHGFFSHTSPDGSTPVDRMRAAGYEGSMWGENIAYYYATPTAVINAWIGSDGHRANLLNTRYREIGIGYFVNEKGTAYWVQNFGSP